MHQGVRREGKKGEAIRLPRASGSSPTPQGPGTRAPARGPHSSRAAPLRPNSTPRATPGGPRRGTSNTSRDNGVTAPSPPSCQHPRPRGTPAISSYADVVDRDSTTAMDTVLLHLALLPQLQLLSGSLLPPLSAPLLAPQLCHRSPLPPAQPRQLGLLTLLTPSRGLPANISVYSLSPYWCGMSTASQKSGQPSAGHGNISPSLTLLC